MLPTLSDRDCLPSARPFAGYSTQALQQGLEQALALRDALRGAHCIHELWMRGATPWQIETALESLWARAPQTIPEWLPMRYIDWLGTVYEVTARFQPPRRGRSNVYLVLLDFEDRRGHPYGVYVGMSHYKPAERFDQHKAGIRAAGCVLRRGLEVLTGPTLHLQGLARPLAARIEAQLAQALRDAGLAVEGGH